MRHRKSNLKPSDAITRACQIASTVGDALRPLSIFDTNTDYDNPNHNLTQNTLIPVEKIIYCQLNCEKISSMWRT